MLKHHLKNFLLVLLIITSNSDASELLQSFNSPAFIPGNGYSQHVLTIEQLEFSRKQKIKEEQKAASDKAERDAKNTNLQKFLTNVESRIYAQLSKQLADAMFSDGGNSGNMDFQGTHISWLKTSSEVTLTITESSGNRTEITVPIAAFAF